MFQDRICKGTQQECDSVLVSDDAGREMLPDVLKNSFEVARTQQRERLSMRDNNDVGAIELQQ